MKKQNEFTNTNEVVENAVLEVFKISEIDSNLSYKEKCLIINRIHENILDEINAIEQPPDENKLRNNTGTDNTGFNNTGSKNQGSFNSGYENNGDSNTGDFNQGDGNVGCWNYGYFNVGNYNDGDYNSGDFNTGNRNTGNNNKADYCSGDFNSINIGCTSIFNHPVSIEELEEFRENTGGTLRKLSFCCMSSETKSLENAYKIWWKRLSNHAKGMITGYKYFDKKVFEEITGICID